jgi:hypothetical protein
LISLWHIAYDEYYNKSQARAHTIKQREIHINHCIDILLQGIQCNINLDPIPLHCAGTQEHPFPDVSVNNKSIDFDGMMEWRKRNSIDMNRYVKVMKMTEDKKPRIKQGPAADQYYEHWESESRNYKLAEEGGQGGQGLPTDVDSEL